MLSQLAPNPPHRLPPPTPAPLLPRCLAAYPPPCSSCRHFPVETRMFSLRCPSAQISEEPFFVDPSNCCYPSRYLPPPLPALLLSCHLAACLPPCSPCTPRVEILPFSQVFSFSTDLRRWEPARRRKKNQSMSEKASPFNLFHFFLFSYGFSDVFSISRSLNQVGGRFPLVFLLFFPSRGVSIGWEAAFPWFFHYFFYLEES